MKKVVLRADLSLVSTKHRVTISGNDETLLVDVIGKSAFYLPYRLLRKAYKIRKQSRYLDQEIQIRRNHRDLLKVNAGGIAIDNYLGLIKILLRSVFA